MHRLFPFSAILVCLAQGLSALVGGGGWLPRCAGEEVQPTQVVSLESQLQDIDRRLKSLARFSLRNEVGAIGHRSVTHDRPQAREWAQVTLDRESTIDEIVLVPTLWRDTDQGFRADGFPVEFEVLAGTSEDEGGTSIRRFSASDALLPRMAPVIIPCQSLRAQWVRVEATVLSPRGFDGKYVFQLSEIMIFRDSENIALGQRVQTSSQGWVAGGARSDRFLVDGDLPYLMNSGAGQQSLPFIGVGTAERVSTLTIDLQEEYPIDRIQLYGIDLSDTAPRSTAADFGVPRLLSVEGARQADFADACQLFQTASNTLFEVAPIKVHRFDAETCRYVRFRALQPYVVENAGKFNTRLGFAELEVFSEGRNVSAGRDVSAQHLQVSPKRPIASLTDQRNLYGALLPIREWLGQLAQRHDLETSRPLVIAELNTRFAQQQFLVMLLKWVAVVLILAVAVTFVVSDRMRRQKIADLRKRFAADLHDEIGANLHSIGLLSDLALQGDADPAELTSLHDRIRAIIGRSTASIRYWADLETNQQFCTDLVAEMRRATKRIVAHLSHDVAVHGEEHLARLNSQTNMDVLLFYKECLINVARHAEASGLQTTLHGTATQLRLSVIDNGLGLTESEETGLPSSLLRRAQLMGGVVTSTPPHGGGTGICLTLPLRRRHR